MSVSAAEIPDKTVLQAIGDRRSIRYYDPEKTVEDWKIQTMLQAGRLASCQGNINATEAIVVTKDSTAISGTRSRSASRASTSRSSTRART